MMKIPQLFFILVALLCTTLANAQFILTLNFEQMDPYEGKTLTVRVYENTTNGEVGRKTVESIENATFSMELYVLLRNRSYNIDFFVDVNANGEYDALPVDHAWRRTVDNPTQNVELTIIADANFTETGWHDAFAYSQYDATWGGKWFNLTFGSTDSIQATIDLTCDSIYGYFTTKGVFGNPEPVEFNFAMPLPDTVNADDTIRFMLPPPWTGEITVFNGDIQAMLTVMGVGLNFVGTVGEKQILCHYTVILGGNPFANGYFYIRELMIHSSAPEIEVAGVTTNVTCPGGTDGSIQLMAEGGIPGYTYQWSTGDTAQSVFGLGAGEYSVTVSDTEGCTQSTSFTITAPQPISITADFENASCFGVCDAAIDITVSGGTPGYSYLWSIGVGDEDLTETCAGVNSVTVTDALGCTAVLAVSIEEPSEITVAVFSVDAGCHGSCDGVVDITVSGGQGPYQYVWSTGFSGEDAVDLCAGTYLVTIIDALGCTTVVERVITEPDTILVSLVAIVDATNGQSNGSIEVSVTGGMSPYLYSLDGSAFQTSGVFTNLPAGTYSVYVMDVNGCEVVAGPFEVLNISGVGDLKIRFNLYPNPASTFLLLEADAPVKTEITDVQGKSIAQNDFALIHRIDVRNLAAGVYVIRISDGGKEVSRKILVD